MKRKLSPMNMRKKQQEATHRAILSALGEQIAETGTMGFSMKDVARRAGVTHRTVYNHFPTREALNDAFAQFVEDELHSLTTPPDEGISITELPGLVDVMYPMMQKLAAHLRAYVMLMVASRAPADVARERSRRFESMIEAEWGPLPPGVARAVTAALRMFVSTTGWHLLTEHHELSNEAAGRTAIWAARVLIEAVSNGDYPNMESSHESNDAR